jgi:hypothetical protein
MLQLVQFPYFAAFQTLNHLESWRSRLAKIMIYLEEYRLIDLCAEIVQLDQTLLGNELAGQYSLIRNAFLPDNLKELSSSMLDQLANDWEYSIEYKGLDKMCGFGHLFQFSTTYGLYNAVQNLIQLMRLNQKPTYGRGTRMRLGMPYFSRF